MDIATITAVIGATTSAVELIDKISGQVSSFLKKETEHSVTSDHRMKIKQDGNELISLLDGQETQRIPLKSLEDLEDADYRHIKVLEKSMENHYSIWESVYPQLALTVDPIIKAQIEQRLKGIIAAMKADFESIMRFIERLGMVLDDHYMHIRDLIKSA